VLQSDWLSPSLWLKRVVSMLSAVADPQRDPEPGLSLLLQKLMLGSSKGAALWTAPGNARG